MRERLSGSIALIDGLGALLILSLLLLGLGFVSSGIEEARQDAMIWIELEGLRSEIWETVAVMNITAQPLDADSFDVGSLRFSAIQEGVLCYPFFLTDDRGVRIFYITEKG